MGEGGSAPSSGGGIWVIHIRFLNLFVMRVTGYQIYGFSIFFFDSRDGNAASTTLLVSLILSKSMLLKHVLSRKGTCLPACLSENYIHQLAFDAQ